MLGSLGLALIGEFEAMLAWWIAIFLLVPPFLWAVKTHYVALISLCSITLATQVITLPFFYLDRDEFAWRHVKSFGFTAWEAFPILFKVSLFLFALIVFFRWFYRISFFQRPLHGQTAMISPISSPTGSDQQDRYPSNDIPSYRNSGLYLLLIVLVVAAMIPLNFWMFSEGISIVGIEPPELPFKLSGILHYLTRFIIPLVLAYLYWKVKRSWLPLFILLAYAFVLGMTSVSRSGFMFVMLPVMILAWVDRRWAMFLVAGVSSLIGFSLVTLARDFVHIVTFGKSSAATTDGIGSIVAEIFSDPNSPILEPYFIVGQFVGIFGRIDGFNNLVMSADYNPYESIGPFGFILRTIWRNLAPLDMDLHHLQWQGEQVADGFYNGGALLSNAVIVGNGGLGWVVASAFFTAGILAMLEKCAKRLLTSEVAPELVRNSLIGFMSLIYFIETGGSEIFIYPFILLCFLGFFIPLFRTSTRDRFKPKAVARQAILSAQTNYKINTHGSP